MSFENLLEENGWEKGKAPFTYNKGSWNLVFDTNSWIEIGSESTPRIFDVPVPEQRFYKWTINLIQHLCETNDALVSSGE